MAASRALERSREGPQSVAAGTEQALETIPASHWEKTQWGEEVWQQCPPNRKQTPAHKSYEWNEQWEYQLVTGISLCDIMHTFYFKVEAGD